MIWVLNLKIQIDYIEVKIPRVDSYEKERDDWRIMLISI